MAGASVHGHWSGRMAFMFAAIGSAVGLGNIWRFPYVTGTSGGGAFVLIYIACLALVALPILIAEIAIGRKGQKSAVNSFRDVAKGEGRSESWRFVGWLGVIAAFMLLTFYSVIAGWAMSYFADTVMGNLTAISESTSKPRFDALLADPVRLAIWHGIFMGITVFIVARGIQGGLEKAVTFMMPALFAILGFLVIYSAIYGDFVAGFKFMFAVDFSKITGDVVIAAVGQAFFSLSLASGIMATYGAYLPRDINIPRAAVIITIADTGVALLAGLAIFPLVFLHGLAPASGPGLIFVTLPLAFADMTGGMIFGGLFFLLLVFAALTSSISLLEPIVSYLEEHHGWRRSRMAMLAGAGAWAVGLTTVLSFNVLKGFNPLGMFAQFEGKTIFELTDYTVSNIMLPVGGLLIAIFAGWFISKKTLSEELDWHDGVLFEIWRLLLRVVAPIALIVVFYNLISG